MSGKVKNQRAILNKLGIEALNEMQLAAHHAIYSSSEIVLLSPTGTGKTLAFLLPVTSEFDSAVEGVQALILVPSRELAIQIEQVARDMGSGYKINAVYGGRSGTRDKIELKHPPALLIGTPGRVADHIRRGNIAIENIRTLILDEFDKSLEIGFEKEMQEIVAALPSVQKKILTSATQKAPIPEFVGLDNPNRLDFLKAQPQGLQLKAVLSPDWVKHETLRQLIAHLGTGRGILFCNFKDTIQTVSDYLTEQNISHTCFYGGLDQSERERALIQFRNGTYRLLVATDLAARGIDVPELDFIIHFQMPPREDEFIHRNGRTARMHQNGIAYIIQYAEKPLPEFARHAAIVELEEQPLPPPSPWETLFISGGRKDKISKGDIAGLFFKQGGLQRDELGTIELKNDCAFVAVPRAKSSSLIARLNNSRLKKKKVRISLL
jgi:superfamily II DNA/RNA helicase